MADLCYMELNLMQIFDVLRSADFVRLALCGGDGAYVAPMAFQLEVRGGTAVVHMASPARGRKIDMLRRCAQVCIEAELPGCGWLDTVLLEGRAVIGAEEAGGVRVSVPAESLTGRRYFLPG